MPRPRGRPRKAKPFVDPHDTQQYPSAPDVKVPKKSLLDEALEVHGIPKDAVLAYRIVAASRVRILCKGGGRVDWARGEEPVKLEPGRIMPIEKVPRHAIGDPRTHVAKGRKVRKE